MDYRAFRPTQFNYMHDAKHTTMFVVAQLWNGSLDEYLLGYLEDILTRVECCEWRNEAHVHSSPSLN